MFARPHTTTEARGVSPELIGVLPGRLNARHDSARTSFSRAGVCGLFHSSSMSASTVSPTAARRAARRMSLRTAAAAQASMGEVRCVSMLSVLSRGNLKVIQQVNPEQMKFAYGVTNVAA